VCHENKWYGWKLFNVKKQGILKGEESLYH
jgi:hypothetical protein